MCKKEEENAAAVVILLDTPGGLVTATLDIIQEIALSPVPVITYVSPTGAITASAGTFILLSGHVAAMPVSMAPMEGESQKADDKIINWLE